MIDLVSDVMGKTDGDVFTETEIRAALRETHGIERIEMEIAQPDRFDEVMAEMVRRDVAQTADAGWRLVE